MPGSPPIKIAEPLTSPPPRTRFNSSMGVFVLIVSKTASLSKSKPCAVPPRGTLILLLEASSSDIEPHSPQSGHCPSHLFETLPQLLQENCFLILVIYDLFRLFRCPVRYHLLINLLYLYCLHSLVLE
mgnify:CR=1 FL=1